MRLRIEPHSPKKIGRRTRGDTVRNVSNKGRTGGCENLPIRPTLDKNDGAGYPVCQTNRESLIFSSDFLIIEISQLDIKRPTLRGNVCAKSEGRIEFSSMMRKLLNGCFLIRRKLFAY